MLYVLGSFLGPILLLGVVSGVKALRSATETRRENYRHLEHFALLLVERFNATELLADRDCRRWATSLYTDDFPAIQLTKDEVFINRPEHTSIIITTKMLEGWDTPHKIELLLSGLMHTYFAAH